ncbi:MAG: hypothetical protein Ta2F_17810 [Termitinemataceae bacterium]|nr:MAG: hypothetical protein Ta2F_17810 [Termitinemataceae bacterium]
MSGTWNISFIKKIFKYIFISQEAICFVLFCILYFTKLIPFDKIGVSLFKENQNDIAKFITIPLPCILFSAAIALNSALLKPEGKNKVFFNWTKYEDFRLLSYIGLAFCFLPIIPTVISWIGFAIYSAYDVGFFYILLMTISAISLATMFFAQNQAKYLLQKYSKDY